MGIIHRLSEEVSGKIAAGEVIEGPFSVVRELIDNSLDADAKQITVTVHNGGKDFIQVADDGQGMSEEDAVLSVQKHTTSKIRGIEDLNSISTMGFRGEALSSICAVSDLTMHTRREDDERGTKVQVHFGKDMMVQPAASNRGTEVAVRELFQNLPARRKFLKVNRTESARIKEEVLKKCLSFFNIGFVLRSDDRLVYTLLPRADVLARIGEVFGSGLERNLIPFSHTGEFFTIRGFVSNRVHTLSNRSGQFIFVNSRPVDDRNFLFAVNNPARGIVPAGRYVHAFVFIEIGPELLDINVHPAKKEIRIRIERDVASALTTCVRSALEERFYPLEWEVGASASGRVREGDRYKDGDEKNLVSEEEGGSAAWERAGERAGESGIISVSDFRLHASQPQLFQGSLPGSEDLAFKGTLFGTYCIFEGKEALLILDQHAAHERVLYERYRESVPGGGPVKTLLVPINITPPRSQYGELLESIGTFREAGFEMEPFGEDSINVLSVPGFIPDEFEEAAVALLIEEFCQGRFAPGRPDPGRYRPGRLKPDGSEIRERFLKIAACRGAVKEGDPVGEEEAFRLLEDLRKTRIPYVCPHGRPTCYLMGRESLEKAFRRR